MTERPRTNGGVCLVFAVVVGSTLVTLTGDWFWLPLALSGGAVVSVLAGRVAAGPPDRADE